MDDPFVTFEELARWAFQWARRHLPDVGRWDVSHDNEDIRTVTVIGHSKRYPNMRAEQSFMVPPKYANERNLQKLLMVAYERVDSLLKEYDPRVLQRKQHLFMRGVH